MSWANVFFFFFFDLEIVKIAVNGKKKKIVKIIIKWKDTWISQIFSHPGQLITDDRRCEAEIRIIRGSAKAVFKYMK